MNDIKVSKLMSLVLRHKPETIGISLDENGWVDINEFINGIRNNGFPDFNDIYLFYIVENNDKKRFKISDNGLRIRASQGHSIDIELNLVEKIPPIILYHGTADRFLDSIKNNGLISMNRQYVHLSYDKDTAINVGKRHGNPVILIIKSLEMYKEGYKFYLSDNNVWLTKKVPKEFIDVKF